MKTKPWTEVRGNIPQTPEFEAAYEAERLEMVGEIISHNLAELRKMRSVTQVELARVLGVSQPALSATEKRNDVQLSTLRDYIEGLGGHLEIAAVFDDVRVPVGLLLRDD